MEVVDVAVVGAGPAGSAAAITLARAGLDVALVDRAAFPRDKACGDGLTTGALRHLERLGVLPDAVASWQDVDACWMRSPSGRVVEFPLPAGARYGAVARRADLDVALVDVARAAGAKVLEGRSVTALAWSPDGVTIAADGGAPLAARYVIGADGAWSRVRKAVGLAEPGYVGEWHAFRQYFHAPGPQARKLWIWFEPGLLPGYAWSFPLPDGLANVGFGVLRRPGTPTGAMAAQWRRVLATPHLAATLGAGAFPAAPHRAWPIPARLPLPTIVGAGGRVLLVGDAARAADPLTGEGIAQALESGTEAATAVLCAGPRRPGAAATRYARRMAAMATDHRLAAAVSRLLQTPGGADAAIALVASSGWTRRQFARWLFEDYPRATVVTPTRWRRRVVAGGGAYARPSPGGAADATGGAGPGVADPGTAGAGAGVS